MSNEQLFNKLNGTFEIDPNVIHYFSDGLYAKQMTMPKGFMAGKHVHNYSHLSVLAKGKVIVRTDNEAQEYTAPACITIKAGEYHTVEALEDCAWFCIHATSESDKVDDVLIVEKD
jgi:quercetin dioxygenase-like cupin family protein